MYRNSLVAIILISTLLGPQLLFAQEYTCPELVQIAFDATDEVCIDTGLNKVCYGHSVIDIDPRIDPEDIAFSEPGNQAEVVQIEKIRLSAMDVENGAWGVALMNLQAYVGNTHPEDITFLMFGDVEIQNLIDPYVKALATISTDPSENLYLAPTLNSEVIEILPKGTIVEAKQRLADNSWLRVENLSTGLVGWVPQSAFGASLYLDNLQVIDAWEPYYGPMQAFYFKSGEDDALCPEAPESGLLIQTPEGVAEVNLIINEVNIQLSSTAFVQAKPNGDMTVDVVSGWASVQTNQGSQTITSGQQVSIPLNNNLQPQGAPTVTQVSNNTSSLPSITQPINRPTSGTGGGSSVTTGTIPTFTTQLNPPSTNGNSASGGQSTNGNGNANSNAGGNGNGNGNAGGNGNANSNAGGNGNGNGNAGGNGNANSNAGGNGNGNGNGADNSNAGGNGNGNGNGADNSNAGGNGNGNGNGSDNSNAGGNGNGNAGGNGNGNNGNGNGNGGSNGN